MFDMRRSCQFTTVAFVLALPMVFVVKLATADAQDCCNYQCATSVWCTTVETELCAVQNETNCPKVSQILYESGLFACASNPGTTKKNCVPEGSSLFKCSGTVVCEWDTMTKMCVYDIKKAYYYYAPAYKTVECP